MTVSPSPLNGARCHSAPDYEHPERAFYVFGPEDGDLGPNVFSWCRDIVYIPSNHSITSECATGLVCVNGTCTSIAAPAPTLSPVGLLIGLVLLLAVAGLAFWRSAAVRGGVPGRD